ncbi:MAG: hypothetical protein JW913_10540 [Chitinispirillaceae bacterium]|nr:hypothetical protein [Chitinispirillaceae bacterium]
MNLSGIPLYWGVIVTVIFYAAMGLWVCLNPGEYIFKGAPDRARWRDLRIWAVILAVTQIIIYTVWGK